MNGSAAINKANGKSHLNLTTEERGPCLSLAVLRVRSAQKDVPLAQEPAGGGTLHRRTTGLTSVQQQCDRQVVISQHRVVQSCAALEVGSDVQAVVEVVLPGYQHCGGKKNKGSAHCHKAKNHKAPPALRRLLKGLMAFSRMARTRWGFWQLLDPLSRAAAVMKTTQFPQIPVTAFSVPREGRGWLENAQEKTSRPCSNHSLLRRQSETRIQHRQAIWRLTPFYFSF